MCPGGIMRRAVVAVAFLAGCELADVVDPDKAAQWAAGKAARMLECQVIDAQTERERRDCLGEFASDLGSSACDAADRWVQTGLR